MRVELNEDHLDAAPESRFWPQNSFGLIESSQALYVYNWYFCSSRRWYGAYPTQTWIEYNPTARFERQFSGQNLFRSTSLGQTLYIKTIRFPAALGDEVELLQTPCQYPEITAAPNSITRSYVILGSTSNWRTRVLVLYEAISNQFLALGWRSLNLSVSVYIPLSYHTRSRHLPPPKEERYKEPAQN